MTFQERRTYQRGEPFEMLGIKVDPVSLPELHGYIRRVVRRKQQAIIPHVNIHAFNLAWKIPWLQDFFKRAHLVYCDGDGVRWGAAILGRPVPVKIAFTRWIWKFSEFCEREKLSLYLLGAKPEIVAAAARRLKEKYPALNLAGYHHGYFDPESEENNRVIEEINRLKPDILLVGFGMPLQEQWLARHQKHLSAYALLPGGGVLDYAAGRLGQAPPWMIRWQIEWLFRIWEEPRRLFFRYAHDIPVFFFRVFREKMTRPGPVKRT